MLLLRLRTILRLFDFGCCVFGVRFGFVYAALQADGIAAALLEDKEKRNKKKRENKNKKKKSYDA